MDVISLLALAAVLVLFLFIRRNKKKSRREEAPFQGGVEDSLPKLAAKARDEDAIDKPRLSASPGGEARKAQRQTQAAKPEPFDPDDDVEALPEGSKCVGPAYVIDGDSLVIKGTQVRLFGVDAPEINHPYGKKAKWALVRLCKGQEIRAELIAVDAHDRTVAKCFLPDGRDLSAEMVKQGLAIDWPKFSGGVYASLETPDARKKLWLASARQKGHLHVWKKFEERQAEKAAKNG
jgi:endonuclease YncB( thermonuclease family)